MISELRRDFGHLRQDRLPKLLWMLVESVRSPGFLAVVHYRLARKLFLLRVPIIPSLIHAHSVHLTGADIAYSASLGPGILITHPVGIVIGGSVTIGEDCTIMHGVTVGERLSEIGEHSNPRIGDRVLLGAGSVCLGGISIGNGSIVGANAVVLIDIPDECTAIGVPARVISSRDG